VRALVVTAMGRPQGGGQNGHFPPGNWD